LSRAVGHLAGETALRELPARRSVRWENLFFARFLARVCISAPKRYCYNPSRVELGRP
jgi:hypothetical protein